MIFTNMPTRLTIVKEKKDWQLLLNEVTHYDFYQTYDYHQISKSDNEIPNHLGATYFGKLQRANMRHQLKSRSKNVIQKQHSGSVLR